MITCGIRVHTAVLSEVVHEFYSPFGWYLGTVMKDGFLQRFSELFRHKMLHAASWIFFVALV